MMITLKSPSGWKTVGRFSPPIGPPGLSPTIAICLLARNPAYTRRGRPGVSHRLAEVRTRGISVNVIALFASLVAGKGAVFHRADGTVAEGRPATITFRGVVLEPAIGKRNDGVFQLGGTADAEHRAAMAVRRVVAEERTFSVSD